jgi:hypothetical protein
MVNLKKPIFMSSEGERTQSVCVHNKREANVHTIQELAVAEASNLDVLNQNLVAPDLGLNAVLLEELVQLVV